MWTTHTKCGTARLTWKQGRKLGHMEKQMSLWFATHLIWTGLLLAPLSLKVKLRHTQIFLVHLCSRRLMLVRADTMISSQEDLLADQLQ